MRLRRRRTDEPCTRCGHAIKPGQLYLPKPAGPRHVACPTLEEVAHRRRVGREP